MAMQTDLLVVAATIEPSVETEWNAWYNDVHLPEIAECPGFLSAQRYVAEDSDGSRRYLSVYELQDADVLQSKEFAARRGWGRAPDGAAPCGSCGLPRAGTAWRAQVRKDGVEKVASARAIIGTRTHASRPILDRGFVDTTCGLC